MNPSDVTKRETQEIIDTLRHEIRVLRRALELALPGYLERAGTESRRATA